MIRFIYIVWEFARKDFRILRSYRLSFFTGIVGAVYGIVSFRFVSNLVGGTKYIGNATEYFRFVVIGVVVAGIMRTSTITTAGNARRDQVEGTLEVLATQPLPLLALGLGWAIVPLLEEIAAGLLTLVIAVPLGFHGLSPNWAWTVLVLLVTGILFISIGFIGAAAVLAIQQGAAVTGIAAAGMALVSGTVFPVAVLPGWLQVLSKVSPLTYALRAARTAMLDGDNTSKVASQTLILIAIAAVMLPLCLMVLRLAFNYARSRGSLSRF